MIKNQEAIYYLSGDGTTGVANSPQLEGFKARGIDVLFMTDPVDQFWLPTAGNFADKPFRSITQGSSDLDNFDVSKSEKESSKDGNETSDNDMDKLHS